jgi:hypothetical protein
MPESNSHCFVSVETVNITTPWTTFFLVVTIAVLMIVIVVLLKIMYVMHLRIEATREAMDWVRTQWRQTRDRRMIREEEQQRLGVWLNDTSEESDCEEENNNGGADVPNGDVHIRRMTREEFFAGAEEGCESETEVEIDPGAGGTISTGAMVTSDG